MHLTEVLFLFTINGFVGGSAATGGEGAGGGGLAAAIFSFAISFDRSKEMA